MSRTPLGNHGDALNAFLASIGGYNPYDDTPVHYVGEGEDRTAWLVRGVVYKVGRRTSANTADHENLTAARDAGMPWAPPTSLHRIHAEGEDIPVLAMPYLTDDGTDADPAALAAMHAQTGGQVDRGNYVVRDGQPIVIDGCTITPSW